MKTIFIVFAALFAIELAFAQVTSPVPSPSPAVAVSSIPTAPTVLVAEPAAPPVWAQQLLVAAQKLPIVGPIVSKAIFYAGMLASILTLIVGTLLSLLKILSGISSLAGWAAFADKIQAFQDGKILYWLKYLSMFNAKKPEPSSDAIQVKPA